MKTKFVLLLSLLSLTLVQCTTVKYTKFHGATKMSAVQIPDTINNIGILNRTRANSVLQTGGITNKPGVDELLSSFRNELSKRNYFKVSTLNKVDKSDQTDNFPPALIKEELEQFYTGQILVASLEVYQVQELNEYINDRKMQLDPEGNEYYIDIVKANKTLQSKSGWRLYNVVDGSVIDEFIIQHDHSYSVEGIDRANATAKMEERVAQAYKDLGTVLGFMYAERMSPVSSYVTRKFYAKSKSCPELKQAADFIKMNDWVTAKNVWLDGLQMSTNPKDIAKLHYNLGVFYEKEGDLDKAIAELEISVQNNAEIGGTYLSQLKSIKQNGYPLPTVQ